MSEKTPAGGAILSAAAVAEWAWVAAWATDEYQDNNHWTAEQRRVVTEGLPAVIGSHAALTARLAAVEGEVACLERVRDAALALWSADAAASEAEPDEYATVAEWGELIEALEALEACDGR